MSSQKKWALWVLAALSVVFVVWIGWGFAILFIYGDGGPVSEPYGGTKALSDRESLEEYVDVTVPVIDEFIGAYADSVGAEVESGIKNGAASPCLDSDGAKVSYSKRGVVTPSMELMLALGQTYLEPGGLELSKSESGRKDSSDDYVLQWKDSANGGFISADVSEFGDGRYAVYFEYSSGCRPTNDR